MGRVSGCLCVRLFACLLVYVCFVLVCGGKIKHIPLTKLVSAPGAPSRRSCAPLVPACDSEHAWTAQAFLWPCFVKVKVILGAARLRGGNKAMGRGESLGMVADQILRAPRT